VSRNILIVTRSRASGVGTSTLLTGVNTVNPAKQLHNFVRLGTRTFSGLTRIVME